jgi:hypothetical protein
MWQAFLGWIKGLFGGNISTQIGKSNKTTSLSATGAHSTLVNAKGDVHLSVPPAPPSSLTVSLILIG